MKTFTIPALAAALLLGGATAAMAGDPPRTNTTSTYGAGAAIAGKSGAVARGATGTDVSARTERRKSRDRRERPDAAVESSTTYGSGAVYTSRDNSSAAVTSGGSATGRNAASSTTVDAYGETTRDGSNADIYGNSNATVGPRPR